MAEGASRAEVRAVDAGRAILGGEGAGGPDQGQFAAQAIGAERQAERGAVAEGRFGDGDRRQAGAGGEIVCRRRPSAADQRFMNAAWSDS